MNKLLILSLVILSACQQWPTKTYRLANGTLVKCSEMVITKCGINLSDCEDGQEYQCQHNVSEYPECLQ